MATEYLTDDVNDLYGEIEELTPTEDTRWPQIFRRNKLRFLGVSNGDSDSLTDSLTTLSEDEINLRQQRKTILVCGKQVPSIVINITLSIALLLLHIVSIVVVPLYAESIVKAEGSLFFMNTFYGICVTTILFIGSLMYSLCSGWPGTMVHGASWKVLFIISQVGCAAMLTTNYAQDPQRTPPYLQAILLAAAVPFTILMRFIFFNRRPSVETLICTLSIVVGIIIASEPILFGFGDEEVDIELPDQSLAYRVLWPAAFLLSLAPVAYVKCLQEKECKQDRVSSAGFMLWIHVINIFSFWSMFWTDIIPHFGTSSSLHDFGRRYLNGLQCVFGLHPQCISMLLAAWVTIGVTFLRYIVTFLLIRYTEGAVYTSMIMSLGSPVGTIFWSLVELYPTLHWNPKYTVATTYTLIGLGFMTPAVLIYNYITYKEETRKNNDRFQFQSFPEPRNVPETPIPIPTISGTIEPESSGGLYNL